MHHAQHHVQHVQHHAQRPSETQAKGVTSTAENRMNLSAGSKFFCVLISIILVIGLFPGLNSTSAYAAEGDNDTSTNEDNPALVEGDEAGDATQASDDIGDGTTLAPLASITQRLTDQIAEASGIDKEEVEALLNDYTSNNANRNANNAATSASNGVQTFAATDPVVLANADEWDGTTITTPQKDVDGVYQITSAAELAGFRDGIDNGDIDHNADATLTTDIDWGSNDWTPIGLVNYTTDTGEVTDHAYNGTFDGGGHTVNFDDSKWLYVDGYSANIEYFLGITTFGVTGFFGEMSAGGVLENLALSGSAYADDEAQRTDGYIAGGFVGFTSGSENGQTPLVINSCLNEMSFTTSNSFACGSIVGLSDDTATIVNCGFVGSLNFSGTSGYGYNGGLVGLSYIPDADETDYMENCYSVGNINYEDTEQPIFGGLFGGLVENITADAGGDLFYVNNCYSACTINVDADVDESYIGGIAGILESLSSMLGETSASIIIQNCYWPSGYPEIGLNFTDDLFGSALGYTLDTIDCGMFDADGGSEVEGVPVISYEELYDQLTNYEGTYASTSGVDWATWEIDGDTGLPKLASDEPTDEEGTAFAVYSATDYSLTFYYGEVPEEGSEYPANSGKIATNVFSDDFCNTSYTNYTQVPWHSFGGSNGGATTIVTDESFAQAKPISCAYWFRNFSSCTSVDLTYLDTSNATSLARMFAECTHLTSIKFGDNFITSNVTNMGYMFDDCERLTSLDLSGFDTSNVTAMHDLFYMCYKLEEITFGDNFNTSQVSDFGRMFQDCNALKSLDATKLDTSSATNMMDMFAGCSSLTSLDVSNFNLSKVTGVTYGGIEGMFDGCSSLTELKLFPAINTSGVTSSSSMNDGLSLSKLFKDCSSLESIDVSDWDVSGAVFMSEMFEGCSSLTSLDLSTWKSNSLTLTDMPGVTSLIMSTDKMFAGCTSLTDLNLGSLEVPLDTDVSYMFAFCQNLENLDLSTCDIASGLYGEAVCSSLDGMFLGCPKLKTIDLSTFNTKAAESYEGFLWTGYYLADPSDESSITEIDSALETIKIGNNFDLFANYGSESTELSYDSLTSFGTWYKPVSGGSMIAGAGISEKDIADAGTYYTAANAITIEDNDFGTIEASSGDESINTGDEKDKVLCTAPVTITVTPNDGCICKGVTVTGESGTPYNVTSTTAAEPSTYQFEMPTEPVTVAADIEYDGLTVTFADIAELIEGEKPGSISDVRLDDEPIDPIDSDGNVYGVEASKPFSFTVTPNNGYVVESVTYVGSGGDEHTVSTASQNGGEYWFTMPDDSVTVTVTFATRDYRIYADAQNDGTLAFSYEGNEDVIRAPYGQVVTITPNPNTGYQLKNITVKDAGGSDVDTLEGSDDDGNYTFTMPPFAVYVVATWEPITNTITRAYTLDGTETTENVGTITLGDGIDASDVRVGTNVTFSVTAEPGYKLNTDGVTASYISADAADDPSAEPVLINIGYNNGTYFFDMPDGAVTITADFTYEEYRITPSTDRNGSISITNENGEAITSAHIDEAIIVTPTGYAGYEISKIYLRDAGEYDQEISPENGVYSFQMPPTDVTVYAEFQLIDYTIDTVVKPETSTDPAGTITYTVDGKEQDTANYQDTIVVTVDPKAGYELDATSPVTYTYLTTVTDESTGETTTESVTSDAHYNNGAYSFTVPAVVQTTEEGAYDITITATFEPKTYHLYGETHEHGNLNFYVGVTDDEEPSTTTYEQTESAYTDQTVYVVASDVATGYELSGLTITYVDDEGTTHEGEVYPTPVEDYDNTYSFTMPAGTTTVEGTYSLRNYEITTTVTGTPAAGEQPDELGTIEVTGGTVDPTDPTDDNIYSNYENVVSFKVTANAGYELVADNPVTVTYEDETETTQSVNVYHNGETYEFEMPAYPVTITATFQAAAFSIFHESDGHGTVTTTPEDSATYGSTVTVTCTPNTGYKLDEITVTDAGGAATDPPKVENNTFTMPAYDVKVEATFTPESYTVYRSINDGTVGGTSGCSVSFPSSPYSVAYDSEASFTVNVVTGYEVADIKVYLRNDSSVEVPYEYDEATLEGSFTMPAGSVMVAVTFAQTDYHIYTDVSEGGSITLSAEDNIAHYPEMITVTFNPDTGYQFKSIEVTNNTTEESVYHFGTGNQVYFEMPDSDVTVTVEFEPQTYYIDNQDDGDKYGKVTVDSSVTFNSEVTFNVAPYEGYEIDSVVVTRNDTEGEAAVIPTYRVDNGDGTYDYTFTMPASDVTITTVFKGKTYHIYTDITGPGTVDAPAIFVYEQDAAGYGNAVEFTVTPDTGYKATVTAKDSEGNDVDVNNEGAEEGAPSIYEFNMPTSDVTITVVFTPLTVEDTSAAGTGTITSTTCGAIAISSGSVIVDSGTVKTPCVSFSDNGTAMSSVWEYAPIRTLYGTAANSITINGGTVESMETYDDESDTTIYGGMAIDFTSYASGTTLTITGGTITGGSGWFGSRATVYVSNGNYTTPASTAPTVNITGGTITTSDTSKNAIELTAYANTTIGVQSTENVLEPRIAGAIYSYATSSDGVYPNIYSGLYTQEPNANFIPSGYECVDYTAVEGYSYLVRQEAVEMYDVKVGTFSHGAVTASPTRAAAGETVTLTIAPDTDYRLASGSLKVNYTDANGTAQTITPEGSGTTYTFEMPPADVTVTAAFEVAPLWEGSGTEDDPYQIWTADDLNNLARKVNTGTTYSYTYFDVMDDITVDEDWIAIGYSSNYHFGGTFDGNLHVITLNASYTDNAAYRTHIGETYGLSSGAYYGTTYLGLFGYLYYSGTTSNIPTVKNVIVDGTLESYDTTYGMNVGGIAGELYYGRIINCENRAMISASGDSAGDYAGGIAGQIYSLSTEVINVYSSGNVTAGQSGGTINRAGGITGNLNPSSVRVSNAVISEGCVITQNGEVRSVSGVSRLFGWYDEDSLGYENAYDRAYIDSGDISQSDLDNWNKMSLGYAPNVLEFWVLDDIQKPIPNADASTATVYKVNITPAENGSIETDVSACAEGGTVKVTLKPADGYEFESITVTRDDGLGTIDTIEGDANVFRFEMPASDVTVSATFTKAAEPTMYTVAFDGNGGSSTESQTVEEGQCATRPADPTREGYLFIGWYTDAECTDLFDFDTPIMSDITLIAGWARDERTIYIVTFDTQGGSEVSSQSVAEGECATRPADPARDGYTFTGWYTDQACTTEFNFDTPITGDITLYAGWQRVPTGDEVTVTFDTNGGTQIPSQQVVRGECATQPDDPEKTGYEFIGWFSDEACTQRFDFSTPIQMSTIIYAGWLPVEYYITIENTDGGTITASPMIAGVGDKIEITVVPDDGYELETLMMTDDGGLSTTIEPDADGKYTFLMPASDVTITATWKKTETPEPEPTPTTHEITIDPVDHASVSVDPVEATAGNTVTITVTPDENYTVDSVTVTATNGDEVKVTAGDNGTYTFTMPDSDVAVEVKVSGSSEPPTPEPATHEITINPVDHASVSVDPTEAAAGATVTITVTPDKDYTVDSVIVTDANTNKIEVTAGDNGTYTFTMPDADVTVEVTVSENSEPEEHKIVVEENTGGSVSVPEEAKAGETVTVTVTADEGYAIATFSVRDAFGNPVAYKDNGDGTYTFTMPDSEISIGVTFAAVTPEKITITKNMFSVDTSYAIYVGSAITKTITSNLKEGTDYTVAYANNAAPGEATITITGIGDYAGTLTYTFKIIHYFEDVGAVKDGGNEWYFDAVYGMVDLGAITGYNETTFGVGDSMSRAQLVTIMWRYCEPDEYAAYDEPASKDTTGLPDAQDGMYYTGAVNWAYANGVITGNQHSDGTYTLNPDDPVTFEQLVTILARYCLGSFDAAADYPQTALNSGNFTDKDAVSDFARGALSWAIEAGVVTGNNNHDDTYTLDPMSDVARERAVTVLYRSINTGLLEQD